MSTAELSLPYVLNAFDFPAPVVGCMRYGCGHINDTFCVHTQPEDGKVQRYILQRINDSVFPRPDELMENIIRVTEFLSEKLRQNGEDAERGTLTFLKTRNGEPYCVDTQGHAWRLSRFVENTVCLQKAETPELFYASARAFGKFQRLLSDFPADTLHETIERFHDTENRLNNFRKALAEDRMGRAASVKKEIDFILDRADDCSVCMNALRSGELPLRVTHNDTKLNNVLLDRATGEGVCVLDLDTVMPGLSVNDFGDSIRFGANHCTEDETDFAKVSFDIDLYDIYAKGFLEEAGKNLTPAEIKYLPWGAKLMTLECGMRFLADYLEGDVYFHIEREGQNLDRCRTQLKLVSDMEKQWDAMNKVVQKYV